MMGECECGPVMSKKQRPKIVGGKDKKRVPLSFTGESQGNEHQIIRRRKI